MKKKEKRLYKRFCDCEKIENQECYCQEYYLHGAHCYTTTPKPSQNLSKNQVMIGIVPDLHINRYNIEIGMFTHCSYQNQTFSLIQKRTEIQPWYDDKSFKCEEEAWML